MARHSINVGHRIEFQDTSTLAMKSGCINREANETKLHPDNTNRKEDFPLSKSWKSLFQTLKE
jgi:hypothetical protein